MSHLFFTELKAACRWMSVWLCFFCVSGCISSVQRSDELSADTASKKTLLQSITLESNPDTVDVVLQGNGKMQYTAVKRDFPLGVMVYLHDALIAEEFMQPEVPADESISSVNASYVDNAKDTAGISILLKENLNYQAKEEGNRLRLTFYQGVESSVEDITGGENIFSAAVDGKDPSAAEDSEESLTSSPLQDPPALEEDAELTAIDFRSGAQGETSIVIRTSHKIRYKMEKSRLSNLELELNLFNTNISESHQRRLVTTHFDSAVDQVIPVNRSSETEPSRIRLHLRDRVPYHLLQEDRKITVFLEPPTAGMEKKPSDTAFTSGDYPPMAGTDQTRAPLLAAMPGASDSSFTAESGLAGSTENRAEGGENLAYQGTAEAEGTDPYGQYPSEPSVAQSDPDTDNTLYGETPVYTGEEISLDFYETDIKNVFRILRTVSGDNFAIDKDVTGNVTLTLDKPVPWDQILDLVLKMNGLGKVREGSIIRIATLETLKKEEEARQALFDAQQKAREQQKQLEPLVTEYISVNYANADADIKPHLEPLLTPERGQLSVNQRTNMIIMTDIQEKIDQARDLIYKLDKVTPQIMISARIVEVNENFSRDLGVNWELSSNDVYRDDIGGVYDFDIAMNYPTSTSNGIGYTFNRLTGTPLLLDAKLTASEVNGNSKIISSPKILTLDNKTAKIDQGVEFGYLSGVDENGNPVVTFKPVKLSLEVTPQVTPDRRVSMTVKISKNEVAGTVANVPSLSTSEAETELLVNDGNTIVIGGVVKTNVSESRSGFPFLSEIPYLGRAFRTDSDSDNRNELLIFITPTIVQLDQRNNLL